MATKSPSVYIDVVDSTEYTQSGNTTTSTNTAMVGYATKGPVGVPTLVTSYTNYKKTFGSPTTVGYSSMAAKNILAAGGGLIFERVADTTASPSKYIVKNGVDAVSGYTYFNKSTDVLVGSSGYSVGKIYTMKATTAGSTTTSKIFYVRAPASGKLTQASILSQISEQLVATSGTYEVVLNGSAAAGFYSFGLEVDGTNIFGTDAATIAKCPMCVKLTAGEDASTIVEAINSAITSGSNPMCILTLSTSTSSTVAPVATDVLPSLMFTKTVSFNIVVDGVEQSVSITIPDACTYSTLVSLLNTALYSTYGVKVYLTSGKLVFIRTDKGTSASVSVNTISYPSETVTTVLSTVKDLFAANTTISGMSTYDSTGTTFANIYVAAKENVSSTVPSSISSKVTCAYNTSTGSLVLTSATTGTTSKVKMVSTTYGDYLLESVSGNLVSNIGVIAGGINGQAAIDLTVLRDSSTKKIRFVSNGTITYPTIAEDTTTYTYTGLYNSLLTIESGVTTVTGNVAVDASFKDMVVIASKEKGSDTNNISVEMYTSTSPIDSTTKHTIYVYVDGSLKETFEDVSLVYASTSTRFDTIINQTVENGGSEYITITVVKNDTTAANVEFPDGTYTIGVANNTTDVAYDTNIDVTAYGSYDYALGTDGIPDDGDSLFEDALSTTGELANTELYDYQILITPDDIYQDVQDAAVALCESTQSATYIADPPVGLSKSSVIAWHNGKGYGRSSALTSKYVEVYSPWCKVYDSTNEKYVWVMPSVIMAAKYVNVDKNYGCWYAPAGETNGVLSVNDIENYYDRSDRDDLYTDYNRVNPIIQYSDGNILAYGEKTCQRKNSTLTKIHTVRMVIEIQRKLQSSLKGYIFMPALSSNLNKIQATISTIMENYKTGGGISSYSVVCDSTNNTTETLQTDTVYAAVACVPVGAIEQISITLSLNKTDNTVTTTTTV